jgi:hypothetical protein
MSQSTRVGFLECQLGVNFAIGRMSVAGADRKHPKAVPELRFGGSLAQLIGMLVTVALGTSSVCIG